MCRVEKEREHGVELECDLELQMGVSMSMKRELLACRHTLLAADNKALRLEKALAKADARRVEVTRKLEAKESEASRLQVRDAEGMGRLRTREAERDRNETCGFANE